MTDDLSRLKAKNAALQQKLWAAEENDKVSREFLAVSDRRWQEAEAQLAAMREALEPFGAYLTPEKWAEIDGWTNPDTAQLTTYFTVAELRRARAALSTPPAEPQKGGEP